ncbi:MAG: hypothetical protein GX362_05300 [Methanosarcinaceae archaeon]|nr:hypothetical protein [Methanosarcinaceae archaeon]
MRYINKTISVLIVFLMILSIIPFASAHAAHIDIVPHEEMEIHAYFTKDSPMANSKCEVYIIEENGNEVLHIEGKTDENGHYKFERAPGITKYKIIVADDVGHKAEDIVDSAASGSGNVWFAKKPFAIFTGIGWILGLSGIILYYLSYRKYKKNKV